MQTRLTRLLDIEQPIIQASMAWISDASLAGAVSAAGGLGLLGPNAGARTITKDVDEVGERLRGQIRKVREITSNPFAVNFVVGTPGWDRDYSDISVKVGIEEKVPVAVVSQGSPAVYTGKLKEAGMKVLHVCSSVRHAQKAQEHGADAVIVSGTEGGGHSGFHQISTLCLVPQAVDALEIPVVAGGGIGDGRGLIAALALGAEGVYMGTRFIATKECPAHENVKQVLLQSGDTSTIAVRHGSPVVANKEGGSKGGFVEERRGSLRLVLNEFIAKALAAKGGELSFEDIFALMQNSDSNSTSNRTVDCFLGGKVQENPVSAGQVTGLIKDVPTCAELIRRIVDGEEQVLSRFQRIFSTNGRGQ